MAAKSSGGSDTGAIYVAAILVGLSVAAVYLVGGLQLRLAKLSAPPPALGYTCCDTGDGANCHPRTDIATFTFTSPTSGVMGTYALLKSNIYAAEPNHVISSKKTTPDGRVIFYSNSQIDSWYATGRATPNPITPPAQTPACQVGNDFLNMVNTPYETQFNAKYYCIPDDELLYICNAGAICNTSDVANNQTPFDVYFRIDDLAKYYNGVVPAAMSTYCPKPTSATSSGQQIVNVPTGAGYKNLQLETFSISQSAGNYKWLSPWCKPAIYLYPSKPTNVHVEVKPQGQFNLTVPTYSENGWNVLAAPNGTITYNNQTYPYLYYEAALPDTLLHEPTTGYVVAYQDLGKFFASLLPSVGLNTNETFQFSDYWLKALPKSNYYQIGIVPQTTLNTLAPLFITPAPDSLLRLSLYFKPLDQKISIQAPTLSSFTRSGFTVVEWGGLFKADKNHPFTCLM